MSDTSNKNITSENMTERSQTPTWIKETLEWIEPVIFALAIIILFISFVARVCFVDGASMENTLYDKEKLVVTNVFYTPKKGDILVFHESGDIGKPVVKRVIGTPGDTVNIEYFPDTMRVTVTSSDGVSEILEEDYIKYERQTYPESETYVEDGTVFVLGDNRSNSTDSRSSRIGLVDQRKILGKVIWRIAPLSRMGAVK